MDEQKSPKKDGSGDCLYGVSNLVGRFINWLLPRRYGCGHKGLRFFRLRIYGLEVKTTKLNKECPACSLKTLQSKAVRCGLCGKAIIPGAPVTYCLAADMTVKDNIFVVTEDGKKQGRFAPENDNDLVLVCERLRCEGPKVRGMFPSYWNGEEVIGF